MNSHVSPSAPFSVRRIGRRVPFSRSNRSCWPALFNDWRTCTSPRTCPEIAQLEASRCSTIQYPTCGSATASPRSKAPWPWRCRVIRWIRPSGVTVLTHIAEGRFSVSSVTGAWSSRLAAARTTRGESVFRGPCPDLPRGHSRICSGAQDARHDVRTIARNNLLSPSVRRRFAGPIHGDEALLATKRRHTAANHAHGRSSGQGSKVAYRNPSAIRALCVNCRFVNVSRLVFTIL
jgi:hypothetical protein